MFVELVSGHSLENPIQLFERWMIGPYNANNSALFTNEFSCKERNFDAEVKCNLFDFSRVVINYPHSIALPVEPNIMRLTLGGNIFYFISQLGNYDQNHAKDHFIFVGQSRC